MASYFGRWDVDDWLEEIPLQLWIEWIAYNRIDPLGEERADLRMGLHTAHVINAFRDAKRYRKPFEVKRFVLKFSREVARPWQSILAMVEMLTKETGGKDLRTKEQKDWRDYH